MRKTSQAYLDYAAAAPLWPEVRRTIADVLKLTGNPSSQHRFGREIRLVIDRAKKEIAQSLGCKIDELVITSGATESINLALTGIISTKSKVKPHVITTSIEHPAGIEPLSGLDCTISLLSVNKFGHVDLVELEQLIRPETILVSIMAANNEIGSIQPVRKITAFLNGYYRNTGQKIYFHTDAAQLAPWKKLSVGDLGCDLLTISGAKLGGPSGSGLLFVKRGTPLKPHIRGGSQQLGRRGGTESVMATVGLAKALELTRAQLPEMAIRTSSAKNNLARELLKIIPDSFRNDQDSGLPGILSLTLLGTHAEAVVYALDQAGIAVSTGSACSTSHGESRVLAAIGLAKEDAAATIRISLGWQTQDSEIELLKSTLPKVIENCRNNFNRAKKLELSGNKFAQTWRTK